MPCPVCFIKLNTNNRYILSCKHNLCRKCQKIWFHSLKKEKCPICNKKLYDNGEEDNEKIINNKYYSRFTNFNL
jgi:Zn-finger nucleic acid-binding protein